MDNWPMGRAKKLWPVGTVVSYKYQGLTTANSKPRFPLYIRIRTDKTWDEVTKDAKADLAKYHTRAHADITWTGAPGQGEQQCRIDYIFYLPRKGLTTRTSVYRTVDEEIEKNGSMMSLSDHMWIEAHLRLTV